MNDVAVADPGIAGMLLEIICDSLAAAVLAYDRNDHLIHAGGHLQLLPSVPADLLTPGTRLRDILNVIFDGLDETVLQKARARGPVTKEAWIVEQTSSLWKERVEHFERDGDRWVQYLKRRLPSGYGVCIIRDVSEQKKREEHWRIGGERIQIIEEVLEQLPFPVCVKSEALVYVAVNQAFCSLVGLSTKDILGRSPFEIFDDATALRLEDAGRQIIKNGIAVTSPGRLTVPDGSGVDVVVRKFRVGNPGRYHVVTALEPGASLVEGRDDAAPAVVGAGVRSGMVPQEVGGKNVLVVTSDAVGAAKACEALVRLGAEASAVADAGELELFLSIAKKAGLSVDLVLLDSGVAAGCAAAAEKFHVPVLAAALKQIEGDAGGLVAEIFGRRTEATRPSLAADVPDDAIDVLVAEDNAVNQIVFSQILEGLGYRYAIAASGVEAVRLWQEHSPQIVLMDITLPEMNGFEACRRIRETEGGSARTPIVGVLAHPFDRDREECFASGMDEVILKPISPEMLETVFLSYLSDKKTVRA